MALEHPAEHQMPESTLEEQMGLPGPDCDDRRTGVLRLGRSDGDRVTVHRQAHVRARRPEGIEPTLVEVHQLAHVIAGDQHARQACLLRPPHFRNGIVQVVQEHLSEARLVAPAPVRRSRPSTGCVPADQPTDTGSRARSREPAR